MAPAMVPFEAGSCGTTQLPGHKTKLIQEIALSGDNAAAYAMQVETGFGSNLEAGMKRIVADMAAAERQSKPDDGDIAR